MRCRPSADRGSALPDAAPDAPPAGPVPAAGATAAAPPRHVRSTANPATASTTTAAAATMYFLAPPREGAGIEEGAEIEGAVTTPERGTPAPTAASSPESRSC